MHSDFVNYNAPLKIIIQLVILLTAVYQIWQGIVRYLCNYIKMKWIEDEVLSWA